MFRLSGCNDYPLSAGYTDDAFLPRYFRGYVDFSHHDAFLHHGAHPEPVVTVVPVIRYVPVVTVVTVIPGPRGRPHNRYNRYNRPRVAKSGCTGCNGCTGRSPNRLSVMFRL